MKTEAFENVQVAFDKVLIAAGAQSGHVSKLAGIGRGEGDLAVPLPVERRYDIENKITSHKKQSYRLQNG